VEYVELLRARRALIWYGAILFSCVALGLALAFKDGPPRIQMSHASNPMIPVQYLLAGAAFGPLILAAFLAVGLDAEYKTVAITWTRPISRLAIALRYVAVDGGALLAAWLLTLAAVFITVFAIGIGKYVSFGHDVAGAVLLVFGAAVMCYGLVVFVTTLLPGRGSAIAGGSWGYALIVPGLASIPFPPLLHQAMVALNYLNPMAYIGNQGSGSHPLIAGSGEQHAIATWLIGLAALAIATQIWTKREVPG
jgi:hypothetical protein